ncbi:MAG TPA: efflux RND transporter periplasmic adaptor subunit [Acetobacteraceae bacterium]|nr:efflux RND transporter periplasmic adaptor subunit [Acetobacteraceae bacterium]
MNEITEITPEGGEIARTLDGRAGSRAGLRIAWLVAAGAVALAAVGGGMAWKNLNVPAPAPAPPPPQVTVSPPLQRTVQPTARFLGQFSAVDSVQLRAQVGGTLTAIDFRDGQIVHKGDPLFIIDPRPFQIRLDEAMAQLHTAQAKEALSKVELWRAQQLKQTEFGTVETVDERTAALRSAQAAVDAAGATVRDAALDLEFSHVTAPFTGRIGEHLVSVGSLVSGSRGGTSPTTLLATIVSLNPIHLDFDMSESDYLAWQHADHGATPHAAVAISLDGDGHYDLHGTLDFIDNAVDRSSGTIHARATVPNPDLTLTPGQFARLRIALGKPVQALMVPDAAVVPDQSQHLVMTVAAGGTIVPKIVRIGELYQGLRVIRSGLVASDRVVIDGLVRARPGAKVTPVPGRIAPNNTPSPSGDAGSS